MAVSILPQSELSRNTKVQVTARKRGYKGPVRGPNKWLAAGRRPETPEKPQVWHKAGSLRRVGVRRRGWGTGWAAPEREHQWWRRGVDISHRMIQKQHQQTRFVNRNESGCNRYEGSREKREFSIACVAAIRPCVMSLFTHQTCLDRLLMTRLRRNLLPWMFLSMLNTSCLQI